MPPLTPRPFSQLARREHRLGLVVPHGLMPFLYGAPWYRRQRRRPAVTMSRSRFREVFREVRRRRWWARRSLFSDLDRGIPFGLAPDPFIVYGACEVA